jgi:spore coat polysaccharide biosynthesis protein SpsF
MSKIGIILQARMGSSRLPGKVLRPMAGKPMLQWIVERLRLVRKCDSLILATSNLPQDIPLVKFANALQINCFTGSESDVLDRYYQCATANGLSHIIRATGDNPFVDPEECDRLIEFYMSGQLAYATISHETNGYPIGVGLEIISMPALEQSWREGQALHHREHVNEYILENPQLFKQARMSAPPEKRAPTLLLTVDTPAQFASAESAQLEFSRTFPGKTIATPWLIQHYSRSIVH